MSILVYALSYYYSTSAEDIEKIQSNSNSLPNLQNNNNILKDNEVKS